MFSLISFSALMALGVALLSFRKKEDFKEYKIYFSIGGVTSCAVSVLILVSSLYTTVPSGHVKVSALFGKVQDAPLEEGLHFPVNPLLDFKVIDGRQKTHKEKAGIPSEDKLITMVDVSVQYRIIKSQAPNIVRNTGDADAAIQVHMIPKLRSILREQGKGIKQAQDFFKESVQSDLQLTLQTGLSDFLSKQGIQVDNVLIRGVVLPSVIQVAITETKKREQEVIKQAAELERYAMEQDQIIKKAESELKAAKIEAEKKMTLAEAEAYRVKTEYIGRAEGIKQLRVQLTPTYINYLQAQAWNGVLPVYAGGENIPMIDLRSK